MGFMQIRQSAAVVVFFFFKYSQGPKQNLSSIQYDILFAGKREHDSTGGL